MNELENSSVVLDAEDDLPRDGPYRSLRILARIIARQVRLEEKGALSHQEEDVQDEKEA